MTIIVPVNLDEITQAVKDMWTDDAQVGVAGVVVERYEPLCKQPTQHGWVSVYRARVDYPPKTLGFGTGYRNQFVRLFAIASESDMTSGEECGRRLDDLLKKLVSTLLSDPTLKGTVDTLDEFSVDYFDYTRDKETNVYMQFAQINFTGVIPVSAM